MCLAQAVERSARGCDSINNSHGNLQSLDTRTRRVAGHSFNGCWSYSANVIKIHLSRLGLNSSLFIITWLQFHYFEYSINITIDHLEFICRINVYHGQNSNDYKLVAALCYTFLQHAPMTM